MSAPAASSPAAASLPSLIAPVRKRPRDDAGEDEDNTQRAPPAQPAAATRRVYLHRHALESIFAYLDIAELATVLAVSRDWQASVGSMRSIDARRSVSPEMLQQLLTSRLRRHVSSLRPRINLTPDAMALLHSQMPHLLRLEGWDLIVAPGVDTLLLPTQLQVLTLFDTRANAAEVNMLLRSCGELSLLRQLCLELKYDASLSFTPLARLPLLRHLQFLWRRGKTPLFNDAQVNQLRALVDLDECTIPMKAASLSHLLRPPHALRWRHAPCVRGSNDEVCALLPTLRCLTILCIVREPCVNFDWLPRMESLTELQVELGRQHPDPSAAVMSLATALQHSSTITSLTLYALYMPITPEQLATCLTGMPALTTLHIWYASLPTLAFLSISTLAQSLSDFVLHDLRQPKPTLSELSHLYGLRSLRRLTLQNALKAPLDDSACAALQLQLPHLESLTHCCDEVSDDEEAASDQEDDQDDDDE